MTVRSQKSLETRSCHLTARHGVQLFADVDVTLHVALDRSVVESAAPVPVEPGLNNTSAQRKHLAQRNLSSRPDAGTISP